VIEHIVTEVYDRAWNWSNSRIRHYIDSHYEMD